MKPIGVALKKIREEMGLTVDQLSKKSRVKVSDIELIQNDNLAHSRHWEGSIKVKRIMKAMGDIGMEVIHYYRLEPKDIPKRKKILYNAINPAIKKMVSELLQSAGKDIKKPKNSIKERAKLVPHAIKKKVAKKIAVVKKKSKTKK
jgi:hypothetical protein